MGALSSDFTGCSILIYDPGGKLHGTTVVTSYDRVMLHVNVEELPPDLKIGSSYRLLILSSPTPCEYQGRVVKEGSRVYIAMFQGQEKESRESVRYKVNFRAVVENLITDGKAYPMHTPLEVELLNISKSGVRFLAPVNSFLNGQRFQMRMKIGGGDKLLIADVVNHVDKDTLLSEYGCQFLIGSEKVI